jgi:alpha-glucosidase
MSYVYRAGRLWGIGLLAGLHACTSSEPGAPSEPTVPSAPVSPPVSPPGLPPAPPRAPGCGDSDDLPALVRLDEAAGSLVLACDLATEELAITPLSDGMVRMRYGKNAAGSIVQFDRPRSVDKLRVGRRGDSAVLCTPEVEMAIVPGTCRMVVKDLATGAAIVDDGPRGGFYRGRAKVAGDPNERDVIGIARSSPPSERFYGLGLHTRSSKSLDLRGKVVELYNTDAYDSPSGGFSPDATSLYESIPFYIGLRGKTAYGIFTDNTHRMRFDLASSSADEARTTAFGGTMDQVLVPGPSMREVVRRYTQLTGRMAAPPTWALGFHQSRWEGPCEGSPAGKPFCSSNQIKGLVGTFREKKIPLDAVFLDIQHMRGLRTFTFDPDRFPNPAGFVAELEALGVKTQVIVDPGLKIDPSWDVYAAGLAGGHYLKTPSGEVFQGEVWPGPSVFPDFTSKGARGFFSAEIERSARLGLRGMWIDMNEPSNFKDGTVPDSTLADGNGRPTTMAEAHNTYGYFEAMATHEGMVRARPTERPFILSRAAFAGQQRFSAVWTGDAPSTWATLEMTLPQLLHLGLSGMAFSGSDVGGYSGRDTPPELFARWMALGAISPFFRAHAEKDARRQEPWSFGDDVENATRDLVGQRYELMPYLISAFEETSRTGAPVLRPLVFDFQDDEATHTISDSAMLGDSLLVAPLLRPSDAEGRRVYLPKGRWFDFVSGAIYEGGRTVTLDAKPFALPSDALPMFAREGAIVPRTDVVAHTGLLRGASLVLDVFAGLGKTEYTLHEDEGTARPESARTTFLLEGTSAGIRFEAKKSQGAYVAAHAKTTVRLRRVDRAPTRVLLDGNALSAVPFGSPMPVGSYAWDPSDRSLLVPVVSSTPFVLEVAVSRDTDPDGTVEVPLRVRLPLGTPDGPISVASSGASWQHLPLTRSGEWATGTLRAPRGGHAFFKITRGAWPTVEKAQGCADVANRHAFGAATRAVEIAVKAWADGC